MCAKVVCHLVQRLVEVRLVHQGSGVRPLSAPTSVRRPANARRRLALRGGNALASHAGALPSRAGTLPSHARARAHAWAPVRS